MLVMVVLMLSVLKWGVLVGLVIGVFVCRRREVLLRALPVRVVLRVLNLRRRSKVRIVWALFILEGVLGLIGGVLYVLSMLASWVLLRGGM